MLDSNMIFKGEVKKASGEVTLRNDDESIGNCSECILFTRNDVTLKMIEKYDKSIALYENDTDNDDFNDNQGVQSPSPQLSMNTWTREGELPPRPSTACKRREHKKQASTRGRRSFSDSAPGNVASSGIPAGPADVIDTKAPSFDQNEHLKLIVGGERKKMAQRHILLDYEDGSGAPGTISGGGCGGSGTSNNNRRSLGDGGKNTTAQGLSRNKSFVHPPPPSAASGRAKKVRVKLEDDDNSKHNSESDSDPESREHNAMISSALCNNNTPVLMRPSTAPMRRQWKGQLGRKLELVIHSNWGGIGGLGLTGLEVLDSEFKLIPIFSENLAIIPNVFHDVDFDKLLNTEKITTRPDEMWTLLTDVLHVQPVSIIIDLKAESFIGGLKIWNYNAGLEESYFGVKRMEVYVDDKPMSGSGSGFLIRKAPGFDSFDYGQFIPFGDGIGVGVGGGGGLNISRLMDGVDGVSQNNNQEPDILTLPAATSRSLEGEFGVGDDSYLGSYDDSDDVNFGCDRLV